MLTKPILSLCVAAMLLTAPARAATDVSKTSSNTPLSVGGVIKADPSELKAQQPTALDPKKIPVVRSLLQGGAELYYLGARSGIEGFLIYKDGKVQVMYVTPDQQTVLFGGMYSADGANISAQQISTASADNMQLKALLTAAGEQQREFEQQGAIGDKAEPSPVAKEIVPSGVSLSPGERLFNDFLSAAGVVVGQEGKPLVLMLIDPNCPVCKATWNELYEPVTKGVLRVKLVPIGAEGSENEKQAARLLRVADPLTSWHKFVGGDKSILAGEPPVGDVGAVRTSMAMALGWKIQATPYIVYRGVDGKIKVVQGKPDKIANILSDLKP